ncbi:hypothetical protein P7K49_022360 [Saguinus oedipus]|uniref:Uncharacterized protein n=1 Tax=Saguinus oedipus TaxID=9490 RepID=A0ABQ9UV96_SAGOE|nr:hypothetical protein P7K49_022360 [Saguinus oedipus]
MKHAGQPLRSRVGGNGELWSGHAVASSGDTRRLRAEGFVHRRALWAVRVEKAMNAIGGGRPGPSPGTASHSVSASPTSLSGLPMP